MDLRLYHNSHDFYYRSAFGAVPSGSRLILRWVLRVMARLPCRGAPVQSNVGESILPMTYEDQAFKAVVPIPDTGCLLWYYFIVSDGDTTRCYGNNYEQLGGEGAVYEGAPPSYQITVYDKGLIRRTGLSTPSSIRFSPTASAAAATGTCGARKGPSSTATGTISPITASAKASATSSITTSSAAISKEFRKNCLISKN